jgi:hypothetical protein
MLPTPPPPLDDDDKARVQHSALRRRLIDGTWRADADERHYSFFNEATSDFLPPAELSRNPALAYWSQTSVSYDEAPTVSALGVMEPTALDSILPPEIWPLAQQRLLYVRAMNEALVRLDITGGKICYRVVPSDLILTCIADPERPDQPAYLEEARQRRRVEDGKILHEWTVDSWDTRDLSAPTFRIYGFDRDGERRDVTDYYWLDEQRQPRGDYPYALTSAPLMPYVLYHQVVGHELWQPYRGRELVEGTLTASALWTMWLMGVRDGSHPQRYIADYDVVGTQAAKGSGRPGQSVIQLNPQTILQLASRKDRPGSAGQWQPTLDPKTSAEAIESFEAGLAQYAGLDPADVQRGSAGQSGYAIIVKRDGLRKMQARMQPAMLMGDQLVLSKAAMLANAYMGTMLPEAPEDYSVRYAAITESAEERKADLEAIAAELAAGLIDEADAYIRRNPGTTREQAITKLEDIARTRARLRAAGQEPPPGTSSSIPAPTSAAAGAPSPQE